jgi:uncharacterized protein (TIGR02300 family)
MATIKGGRLQVTTRGPTVAKPELGTKRICPNCGAKYYDLHREPIICPRCGTRFEGPLGKARPQPAPEPEEEEEEVVLAAPPEAELVALEEADEEAADTGAVKVEGEEDEEEIEAEAAEDPFIEVEEEDGDDVTDIIGGVDEEE